MSLQSLQDPQDQAQAASDERLFVKFYMGTRKNEERSLDAGHPVFDDVPFVRILVPGDKNTVIDTTVDDTHRRRFARLWQQFVSNAEQTGSGMPMSEWPAITRSQCEELKYMNIFTVEQLAELPDVYGGKIMGFNDLKRKAATYLAAAKDSALTQKLSAVNVQQAERITALEAEIGRLSAAFSAMQTGKAPDGGNTSSGVDSHRRK